MRTVAAGLLAATIGCFSHRPAEQSLRQSCAGDYFVIVTNNLGEAIDIQATVADRSTPITLGAVSAGERREFVLPSGAQFVYPHVSSRGMNDAQRERIQIRYECRS
jgi:hypothetical protein